MSIRMMDMLFGILGPVITIAFLAGIVVCFSKGRRGYGWFGVVAFVLGATVWFPLFSCLRNADLARFSWVPFTVGTIPAVIVLAAASGPALPGSSWDEHTHARTGS